jgi:hypothetical protein
MRWFRKLRKFGTSCLCLVKPYGKISMKYTAQRIDSRVTISGPALDPEL